MGSNPTVTTGELARCANWHSGQVESLMFVGSTPTLVTAEWTGVWFPARSHKPSDAGSNPASATSGVRVEAEVGSPGRGKTPL